MSQICKNLVLKVSKYASHFHFYKNVILFCMYFFTFNIRNIETRNWWENLKRIWTKKSRNYVEEWHFIEVLSRNILYKKHLFLFQKSYFIIRLDSTIPVCLICHLNIYILLFIIHFLLKEKNLTAPMKMHQFQFSSNISPNKFLQKKYVNWSF